MILLVILGEDRDQIEHEVEIQVRGVESEDEGDRGERSSKEFKRG